jgi:hypothetical protein
LVRPAGQKLQILTSVMVTAGGQQSALARMTILPLGLVSTKARLHKGVHRPAPWNRCPDSSLGWTSSILALPPGQKLHMVGMLKDMMFAGMLIAVSGADMLAPVNMLRLINKLALNNALALINVLCSSCWRLCCLFDLIDTMVLFVSDICLHW